MKQRRLVSPAANAATDDRLAQFAVSAANPGSDGGGRPHRLMAAFR
jgi:hypothetical protein